MPFYEYQCKNCGHELEAMQKVSEPALKKCPHCSKGQLQRLMSAPVFRLKGSGWYETDFKDDKDKKRNLVDSPDAEASKDPSASAEKKADAKPEAKLESKDAGSAIKKDGGESKGAIAKPEKTAESSAATTSKKKTDLRRQSAGRGSLKKLPAKTKRRR